MYFFTTRKLEIQNLDVSCKSPLSKTPNEKLSFRTLKVFLSLSADGDISFAFAWFYCRVLVTFQNQFPNFGELSIEIPNYSTKVPK